MMEVKIELFSTDCVKCKRLEFSLHQALSEAGIEAELLKVSDIKEMEKRGLRTVPALAIDGEIIFAGIVPPVSELRKILIEKSRP
jgi:small redox-active disulfide protein 2